MKPEAKKTKPQNIAKLLIMMAIAAVFFVAGFYLFPFIFGYIIPQVDGVSVVQTELSTMFKLSLLMGFAFAIIPFAINSGWQLLKLESGGMKSFFAIVVLCGPLAAIIIRKLMLEKMAEELYELNTHGVTFLPAYIQITQIKAAEAVMIGTIVGWVFAMGMFAVFKKKPTADSSLKTT